MARRAVAAVDPLESIRSLVDLAFSLIRAGDFDGYFDLFTEDAV